MSSVVMTVVSCLVFYVKEMTGLQTITYKYLYVTLKYLI